MGEMTFLRGVEQIYGVTMPRCQKETDCERLKLYFFGATKYLDETVCPSGQKYRVFHKKVFHKREEKMQEKVKLI